MVSMADALRQADTLTFDCYGTLIDWHAGLTAALGQMFGDDCMARMSEALAVYFALEAEIQAEAFQTYRQVLTEVARRLSERFGWTLPQQGPGLLPELLPTWQPFSDTVEALQRLKHKFRLGVLSNVDRDLFAGTAALLGVDFDFVVTAEDVRAYKPNTAHFKRCFSMHAPSDHVIHVAQSLYHDGVPARRLGFAFVWINRYNDINDSAAEPLAEFGDLKSFADQATG